jgi:hypothetical protein
MLDEVVTSGQRLADTDLRSTQLFRGFSRLQARPLAQRVAKSHQLLSFDRTPRLRATSI